MATACATLKDAAERGAGVEVKLCQHERTPAIYDKSVLEMQGGFHCQNVLTRHSPALRIGRGRRAEDHLLDRAINQAPPRPRPAESPRASAQLEIAAGSGLCCSP